MFSILVGGVFCRVLVKFRCVWVCMVWLLVDRLVGSVLISVLVLVVVLVCSRVSVRLSFSFFLFGLVVIVVCSMFIWVCGFSGVGLFLVVVVLVGVVGIMLCWVRNLCSWFFGIVFGKLLMIWLFLIRKMVGIEWIWKVVVICCF